MIANDSADGITPTIIWKPVQSVLGGGGGGGGGGGEGQGFRTLSLTSRI